MKNAIVIKNLTKKFGDHVIFDDLNLAVEKGSLVAITGASGTGKSTLLNIIGLLEKKTSGEVEILGQKNLKINSLKARDLLRNQIGYMFQNYALLENEKIEQNVKIGMKYGKYDNKVSSIKNALKEVGLADMEKRTIFTLSGGEQQRVALARLMLKPCSLVLADEPTGNLDESNRDLVFDLLIQMKKLGKTIVVVTHDRDLLSRFDRVFEISDRKVI